MFNIPDLLKEIYRLREIYNKAVSEYAEAKIKFKELDNARKVKFAQVVETQEEKTKASKEQAALLDPEWITWNDEYSFTEIDLIKKTASKQIATTNYEACRTILSAVKVEMGTSIYEGR